MGIFKESYKPKNNKQAKPIEYVVDDKGCWICISHYKDKDGYPMVTRQGKTQPMTRYIFSYVNKKNLPKGYVVRHKCDNPSCINPEHLLEGTYMDNRVDMLKRNRPTNLKEGEEHHRAYDLEVSRKVRELLKTGKFSQLEIAEKLGVSQSYVSAIFSGNHWTDKELGKFDKENVKNKRKKSNQKLSEEDVIEIKKLLKQGVKGTEITRMYGVNSSTVSGIKRGTKWSHIKI